MTSRCDVAVVGAGLCGLLAAHLLADAADVVLVDSHPRLPSASARSLGIAASGGVDSPVRLARALGEATARELWCWSADSIAGLGALARSLGVEARLEGSLRLALHDSEAEEWSESVQRLEAWCGPGTARGVTASELQEQGLSEAFLGGALVSGDGQLDVQALSESLRQALTGRCRELRGRSCRVAAEDASGLRLELDDGSSLSAEILVVAAGWASGSVHSWFGPMLYPVRLQGLRTGPLATGLVQRPVLARHRFENWLQDASGRLSFTGCRWAEQPEMEAGVVDADSQSERVTARQREFLEQHLPGSLAAGVEDSWSGIAAFGCDGLPLVGPLPGNPRVVALAGWGGWGLSWIHRAAREVCSAVLGHEGGGTPAILSPRRML